MRQRKGVFLSGAAGGRYLEAGDHKRKTAANAFFVDNGIDLVVDSGYYYRIRGSHLAILGSESDAGYTVTNGLYID